MKYSTVLASITALVSSAQAIKFTNSAITPVADKSFTLTWDDASDSVDIYVVTGTTTNDLANYETVGTGLTGGSYTFTLSASDYASGVYAFKIVDGNDTNYSERFSLVGTKEAASTTNSASVSVTTSKATTSSATSSATSSDASSSATSSDASSSAISSDASSSTTSSSASSTLLTSTVSAANATTTSKSTSSSAKTTSSSTASSTGASSSDIPGEAGHMASPLALILVSAAAMVFLN